MVDPIKGKLSSLNSEEYVNLFGQTGWFEDVPADEIKDLKQRLSDAFDQDSVNAWGALTEIWLDSEFFSESPYTDLLKTLSKFSKGRFEPEALDERLVDNRWRISFTLSGKSYEFTANDYGDYYDDAIFGVVDEALSEAGYSHRFINLPSDDQCYYMAFVRQTSFESAKSMGLIPHENKFM